MRPSRTASTIKLLIAMVCFLAMLTALPTPANATPVLQRIDARISQAEQETLRWDGRLSRWQERVANDAARLEKVLAHPPKHQGLPANFFHHRSPRFRLPPNPLSRASTRLASALHDPKALEAKEQATEWRRYMTRLKAARRQALAAGRGAGVTGLPGGLITYATWGRAFLHSLKAPACTSNMRVVVAWETAESTLARYNPLATAYALPGSTSSNSSNVQNFGSFAQGIEATRNTLLSDPGTLNYVNVVDDLLRCAPAGRTALAVRNSSWCAGCARGGYLTDQLAAATADWPEYATRLVASY